MCDSTNAITAGRVLSTLTATLTSGLLTVVFGLATAEIDQSTVNFPRSLPFILCCVLTIVFGILFILMVVASWIRTRQLRIALVVFLFVFAGIAAWITSLFLITPSSLSNILEILWTSDKFDGSQRLLELKGACCGWAAVDAVCSQLSNETCQSAYELRFDWATPLVSTLSILGFLCAITSAILTIIDVVRRPPQVENEPIAPDQTEPPGQFPQNDPESAFVDDEEEEENFDSPPPTRPGFEISDISDDPRLQQQQQAPTSKPASYAPPSAGPPSKAKIIAPEEPAGFDEEEEQDSESVRAPRSKHRSHHSHHSHHSKHSHHSHHSSHHKSAAGYNG
jgi:hypothetical protein